MGKFSKTGKHRKSWLFKKKYKKKYRKSVIIYAPHSRSKLINAIEYMLAFLGTALLWVGAGFFLFDQLFGAAYIEKTKSVFLFLSLCALLVIAVSAAWQYYNWYLYHGKDRRKAFPMQSLKEIGEYYGINESGMQVLQGNYSKVEVVHKDEKYFYNVPGQPPIEIVSLRKKDFSQESTN